MKFADVKGMNVDELSKKKREVKEELFQSKMKNSLGQLNNPVIIRKLRHDIARIETALRQKQ